MSLADRWNEFWYRPTPATNLAVARMLLAWALWRYLRSRDPSDPFSVLGVLPSLPAELYEPVSFVALLNLPPPTTSVLSAVYTITLIATIFMGLGLLTRVSTVVVALGGLWLLVLPSCWGRGVHGHNVLGMMLIVLPFARSGAALSIDALIRNRGRRPPPRDGAFTWPLKLLQLNFAFMFFFAGLSKLRVAGLDWITTDSLRNIFVMQNWVVRSEQAVHPVVEAAVGTPALWWAMALGTIVAELGLIGAVFARRWWTWAISFSMGLGLILGLEYFMRLPNRDLLVLLGVFVPWSSLWTWARDRGPFSADASAPAVPGTPAR